MVGSTPQWPLIWTSFAVSGPIDVGIASAEFASSSAAANSSADELRTVVLDEHSSCGDPHNPLLTMFVTLLPKVRPPAVLIGRLERAAVSALCDACWTSGTTGARRFERFIAASCSRSLLRPASVTGEPSGPTVAMVCSEMLCLSLCRGGQKTAASS